MAAAEGAVGAGHVVGELVAGVVFMFDCVPLRRNEKVSQRESVRESGI